MANGEAAQQQQQPSVFYGMPWQVRAFAYVGFPVVAACFLGWLIFSMLQPHVLDTRTEHSGMVEATESLAYTNFVMCQRSASTKEESEKCIKPRDWSHK